MKQAAKLGVDYIGLIVETKKSPRSISRDEAMELAKKSKLKNVVAVVTEPDAELLKVLDESGLFCAIEIHRGRKLELKKTPLWIGVAIESSSKQKEYSAMMKYFDNATMVVLNSPKRNLDSDERMDIEERKVKLKEKLEKDGKHVAVSGGINEFTIWTVMRKFEPEVIDISAGIEDRPGVQSNEKMKAIIEAVNDRE